VAGPTPAVIGGTKKENGAEYATEEEPEVREAICAGTSHVDAQGGKMMGGGRIGDTRGLGTTGGVGYGHQKVSQRQRRNQPTLEGDIDVRKRVECYKLGV